MTYWLLAIIALQSVLIAVLSWRFTRCLDERDALLLRIVMPKVNANIEPPT